MNGPEALAAALQLDRPLVFLDVESSTPADGCDPDPKLDRIVQMAVLKIYPDAKVTQFATLVNPGIPISHSTTEIHGITDDMVKNAPAFKQIGRIVAAGLSDSDLAGYNLRRYDFRLFINECERNGIAYTGEGVRIVDPFLLWARMEPRDLTAWVKRFLGVDHIGHEAELDVAAVVAGLPFMLDAFPELPRTVADLSAICHPHNPVNIDPDGKFQWRGDVPTVCFGDRYLDWDMRKVPSDFWDWLLRKGKGFSPQVKKLANDALKGVYPTFDGGQQRLPGVDAATPEQPDLLDDGGGYPL